MSGPDETLPPGPHEPTIFTELPVNDTVPPPPSSFGEIELPEAIEAPIPAGAAQAAFAEALDALAAAFVRVEAVGQALARLVDSQASQGAP